MKRQIVAIGMVMVAGCAGGFDHKDDVHVSRVGVAKRCNDPSACKIEIKATLVSSSKCTVAVGDDYKTVIVGPDDSASVLSDKKVDLYWVITGSSASVQFSFKEKVGILISGNRDKYFKHVGNDKDGTESHWKATKTRSADLPYDASIQAKTSAGGAITCDPLDPIIAND